MALSLHASGLFPDLASAQQALTKIVAGAELGLSPIAALNGFHIVKGKIMTHYSVIGWRVRQVGYKYKVTEHTADICRIAFFDPDGDELGESSFSAAEAVAAGVGADGAQGGKGMLKKFPKIMLFARAMSNGARMFCPEAFNGMVVYSHEERSHFEEAEPEDKTVGTSARITQRVAVEDIPEEFSDFLGKDEPVIEPVTQERTDALNAVATEWNLDEFARADLLALNPDPEDANATLKGLALRDQDITAALHNAGDWVEVKAL